MNESKVLINLDNLKNNVKALVNKYDEYKYYIGVVKSDAYGHGERIVNSLIDGGINYLAVSYIREALDVRKYNKDIPILVLEPIDLDYLNEAIDNKLTLTIDSLDHLKDLISKCHKKIKVHIKLDTGMNRLGFKDKHEVKEAVELINENKYIDLEGMYSHFATVGIFDKHYDLQVRSFKILTSLIDIKKIPIVHFSSSVTVLAHDKLEFCNGCRLGIVMYGYNVGPTKSNNGLKNKLRNLRTDYFEKKYDLSKTYFNIDLNLKPSMKLETYIIETKKVKKGEYVGYGAKIEAQDDMYIGILPIGYNNGIGDRCDDRYVVINGNKYKILNIAMNMTIIKIDENVKEKDKVTILGDGITLGAFSRSTGFGLAESLLMVGKNNNRVYIEKNKEI